MKVQGFSQKQYNGIEKSIFSKTYTLFLKYKDMSDTDENWNEFLQESKELVELFNYHKLARNMVSSVIEQVEHRVTQTQIKGKYSNEWNNWWEEKQKESIR